MDAIELFRLKKMVINLPTWNIFITFIPKYVYNNGNISDGNKIWFKCQCAGEHSWLFVDDWFHLRILWSCVWGARELFLPYPQDLLPILGSHQDCYLAVCQWCASWVVFGSIVITRILLSREVDGTLLADCICQPTFPSHLRRGVYEGCISRANQTFCHRCIGTSPSHQGDGTGRVHLVGGNLEDLRFQVSYYSQEIKSCWWR